MLNLFMIYFKLITKNKVILFVSTFVLIMIMSFTIQTISEPPRPKIIVYQEVNTKIGEIFNDYLSLNNDVISTNDKSFYEKCLIENECNVGINIKNDIDLSISNSNISDYYRTEVLKNDNYSIPILYDLDTLLSDLIFFATSSA